MATSGYIYKGLKPVHWCPDCVTALAEAEIEYAEDPCYSIYVKFAVSDDKGILSKLGVDPDKTYFVIWTTTTWTLPANLAICVGSRIDYSIVECDGEYYIMATALYEKAMEAAGKAEYEVVASLKGAEMEYMKAKHPFIDRESLVIVGGHCYTGKATVQVVLHTSPAGSWCGRL